MPPAIRVSGLSKLYRVGARQQGYRTLRESIADAFWAPFRSLSRWERAGVRVSSPPEPRTPGTLRVPEPRLSGDHFLALQDVSFDVQPGEVVGIIGRNGAGKSTLLKILSRITEPTSGRIELRGRVGSLLEVGTGFHPELTGRENIYMNGSILGMSRREIARKFDEIVDFSGVEDFLDTPVKRYSSGMYVRLAFAVAAHLEPEILIVDEVLAVGDAGFQKKCLGKMRDVARGGRTVLFVSHNMAAVQSLCSRGVLLQDGAITFQGSAADSVTRYVAATSRNCTLSADVTKCHREGVGPFRFTSVSVRPASEDRAYLQMGDDLTIELGYTLPQHVPQLSVGFNLTDLYGNVVYRAVTRDMLGELGPLAGQGSFACHLRSPRLVAGVYTLWIVAHRASERIDMVPEALTFEVEQSDVYGTGRTPVQGSVYPDCGWQIPPAPSVFN